MAKLNPNIKVPEQSNAQKAVEEREEMLRKARERATLQRTIGSKQTQAEELEIEKHNKPDLEPKKERFNKIKRSLK